MELKTRDQMDPAYQWDLTPIFGSTQEWETAFAQASEDVEKIASLSGTLSESPQTMADALGQVYDTLRKVERVYLYASLCKHGDNGSGAYQKMEGMATQLYTAMLTVCAFLNPEILAMEQARLRAFMEEPCLATYRHLLDDIDRARPHTLDENSERLLGMLSDAATTPDDCFTMLESVDMTFPSIRDENGEEVTLTHGNYALFRISADRRVRRDAFEQYHERFQAYENTFAAMYAGAVKFDAFQTKARNFESDCERALFVGNVPLFVYDRLIDAVHDALPIMEQYLSLRKRVLGLDTLEMYDLYCPMVEDIDLKLTYPEAQELVLKAAAPLGEEYQSLLRRAFSEHWIDVYENKGKTTGAFSCGVYGVHPYILLNFAGTIEDAFTLAHELGHSLHSCFSDRAQDFVNHDYHILVAEVASTVNEVLLTKYLLATEKDPKRRAYYLNHFLEGFRTTVYRQTLFSEFERRAHAMYQDGEPLTAEVLDALYGELNALYYKGVEPHELQAVEWARVPHFYTPFYVYQYATGFSAAVAIADRILKSGDPSDYLRFLSTGGSMYPIDELKIAGVDLTSPDTVKAALDVFHNSLCELEELLTAL